MSYAVHKVISLSGECLHSLQSRTCLSVHEGLRKIPRSAGSATGRPGQAALAPAPVTASEGRPPCELHSVPSKCALTGVKEQAQVEFLQHCSKTAEDWKSKYLSEAARYMNYSSSIEWNIKQP